MSAFSPFARGRGVVKICGLRRPEHAVAAVEAGADLLGFVFAPSKRRVTAEAAAACVAAARGATERTVVAVGVFLDAAPEEIRDAVEVAGLDLVQLHGTEPDGYAAAVSVPTVRALRAEPGTLAPAVLAAIRGERDAPPSPVAWLIDGYHPTAYGGTGVRADWTLATALAAELPLILAGGLTPENVAEAIRRVRPLGVDVSTGVERDGEKAPALIAAFVRAARVAFDLAGSADSVAPGPAVAN